MAEEHTTSQPWNVKSMLNAYCEQHIRAMLEADLMRTMPKNSCRLGLVLWKSEGEMYRVFCDEYAYICVYIYLYLYLCFLIYIDLSI